MWAAVWARLRWCWRPPRCPPAPWLAATRARFAGRAVQRPASGGRGRGGSGGRGMSDASHCFQHGEQCATWARAATRHSTASSHSPLSCHCLSQQPAGGAVAGTAGALSRWCGAWGSQRMHHDPALHPAKRTAMTSPPPRMRGMASACTGVGSTHPMSPTARMSSGASPISSKEPIRQAALCQQDLHHTAVGGQQAPAHPRSWPPVCRVSRAPARGEGGGVKPEAVHRAPCAFHQMRMIGNSVCGEQPRPQPAPCVRGK